MCDRRFDTGLIARFSFFTLFSSVVDSILCSTFFLNILIIAILDSFSGRFNMQMNFGFVGTLHLNNGILKNVSFSAFTGYQTLCMKGSYNGN